MTSDIVITDMPANSQFARTAAQWAFDEWGWLYPDDSVQWYVDLYAEAEINPLELPVCVAALTSDGDIAGTASVIVDDELPDAMEPGPWLAVVFVNEKYRGEEVGKQLVNEAVRRAREIGHGDIYLYTENVSHWYKTLGWETVRDTHIRQQPVTVMINRG